jgi:3-oxoacyl-[acyl-carrier protein] reductase
VVLFDGKVVLVTGSSRNIGKAIARKFAVEGARVVLNAKESADELAQADAEIRALGAETMATLADVADPVAVASLIDGVLDRFGRIDTVVLSHAVRPYRPFAEITHQEWHEVIGVNLHSAFYLCQAVLPGMAARGEGNIVAIGGDVSTVSTHYPRSHAFAALAGQRAMLRTLVGEYGPHGVRINFVAPGVVDTVRKHPEWYPDAPRGGPQTRSDVPSRIPMRRVGTPDEIADVVLFVTSDAASYLNGATIDVHGGGWT